MIFLRFCITGCIAVGCIGASFCHAKTYSGPAGGISLESKTFGKTEFVSLYDLAESLGLSVRWHYEPQKVELRNHVITLDFSTASRFVLVDKHDTVRLNAGLVFIKGEPFVPASFLTTTLKPYFSRLKKGLIKAGIASSKIIVIDPGHGGKDTGTIGYRGMKEREIVLDVADRVRAALVKKGYKVRLTRSSNSRFVPLVTRADIANQIGAAVFVSIHANSVAKGTKKVSGSETYYLSKAQKASSRETERIENSVIKYDISSRWGGLSYQLKRIFMRRHFQSTRDKSRKLAESVQRRVSRAAVGRNRGIKRANYEVLRNVYCPACLVEIGFIDHRTDATYLKRSSYKQKIADAIAQGITDYLE